MSAQITDERSIEDGMLIALSAVRMAVKNQIIVGALRDRVPYDPAEHLEAARTQLAELARENEDSGRRIGHEHRRLQLQQARGRITANQEQDLPRLEQRRRVHKGLASALKALGQDTENLDALVAAARLAAADEIREAVTARLTKQVDELETGYESKREARLRTFVATDLAALLAKNSHE